MTAAAFVGVAGVIAFAVALMRGLLVEEVKGWLADRRDGVVEAAISSLPDSHRALFEEDWRATYEKSKHRPLTSWRCAREFKLSARTWVAEQQSTAEPQPASRESHGRAARIRHRFPRSVKPDSVAVALSSATVVGGCVGLAQLAAIALVPAILASLAVGGAVGYVDVALVRLLRASRSMARTLAVVASHAVFSTSIGFFVAQPVVLRVFEPEIQGYVVARTGHGPTGLLDRLDALSSMAAEHASLAAVQWLTVLLVITVLALPVVCSVAGRLSPATRP